MSNVNLARPLSWMPLARFGFGLIDRTSIQALPFRFCLAPKYFAGNLSPFFCLTHSHFGLRLHCQGEITAPIQGITLHSCAARIDETPQDNASQLVASILACLPSWAGRLPLSAGSRQSIQNYRLIVQNCVLLAHGNQSAAATCSRRASL